MRRSFAIALALFAALVLPACGTSSHVNQRYAPAAGDQFAYTIENPGGMIAEDLTTLRTSLDSQLRAAGLLAATPSGAERKVTITINEYRMRHGAARALVGIMAGKDTIRSTVKVVDANGRVLGATEVDSGNSTAWGTTDGLIEGHAEEIANFLRGTSG
jgi:hypothetical protein